MINIKYFLKTKIKLFQYQSKKNRILEIGPGLNKVEGFETIDIVGGPQIDYVTNASEKMPFLDNTFDVIYSSHVLEHIPWFKTEQTLSEWIRILAPGGRLEIWVPDGLKICQLIVDQSTGVPNSTYEDGWLRNNPRKDPFIWANGRLFYGIRDDYPSWHQAIFTAESLIGLFKLLNLVSVRELSPEENRATFDHGWINLGVFGQKV